MLRSISRDLMISTAAALLALAGAVAGSFILEPMKFKYEIEKNLFDKKMQLYFDINKFVRYETLRKLTQEEKNFDVLFKEVIDLSVRADLLFGNEAGQNFMDFSTRVFMEGPPSEQEALQFIETMMNDVNAIRELLKKNLDID